MDTLLEASGNDAIVTRIGALAADTPALWGKMNVAQMLVHCQRPFLVASDELKLPRGLIGRLFGGMAKKRFVDGTAPFGKNSPTDPAFRVKDRHEFAREQAGLVRLVTRFGTTGASTRDPHPFFGPLTGAEWDRLLWKHLDHHLRQFGA